MLFTQKASWFLLLFLSLFTGCARVENEVLFNDPLNGSSVEGWKVAPENFVDHPEYGKVFLLESDTMFTSNPPWVQNSDWANYRMEIELLANGGHWFGVDFHVNDEGESSNNIQFFMMDTTYNPAIESASIHGSWSGAVSWKLYPFTQSDLRLEPNEWIKLRIDVGDNFANCFINDSLVHTAYDMPYKKGGVRLVTILPAKVYLKNFKITSLDGADLQPLMKDEWSEDRKNYISDWKISEPYPADTTTFDSLPNSLLNSNTEWIDAKPDSRGIVNLGMLFPDKNKNHGTFAKTIISSDADNEKKAWITYTDRCRIYCNDELIFTGPKRAWDDPEANHDCRLKPKNYKVILPLTKGDNEIVIQTQTLEPWGWGFALALDKN